MAICSPAVDCVQFTWSPAKAWSNLLKHGMSFEKAAAVFFDPLAWIHDDPAHSTGEQREIIIGTSSAGRLLLISFTENVELELIRIISARQADSAERHAYEEVVTPYIS
jgi:uncharacterized DUF497 family protein